jgi:NAD(P)H-hydrate epimerase
VAPGIDAPLVIDADGLNAFAGRLEEIAERNGPTVLTPHAGELGRLLEVDSEAIGAARLRSAQEAAERSGAVVVLKGDDTLVAEADRVAVNDLASPALATAGTGDVLAGTIGALLARRLDSFLAAACGARAGARAGRLAAQEVGNPDSVIAGDVVAALPRALTAGPLP